MSDLSEIDEWPVDHVAAAIVRRGVVTTRGDIDRPFPLASLTKLITALAVLVAHEEGTLSTESIATEHGATVGDLLAHAGGIAPDGMRAISPPRTRRIYSTAAYDKLAHQLAVSSAMSHTTYIQQAVLQPAGMDSTIVDGPAGSGAIGTVRDVLRLIRCWSQPVIVSPTTLDLATSTHLPQLSGVLPGYGRQSPNPWGFGPEIRGSKSPHWTGSLNSPTTFGHFGRSGTMMWIDRDADVSLVALTDREFGPWAMDAWPKLSDSAILGV